MILAHKSEYYYDFWRLCDTEDWSNDAENTEINYSLTHIHIENIVIIFHNIHIFLKELSNKSSLGVQMIHILKQAKKNNTFYKIFSPPIILYFQ